MKAKSPMLRPDTLAMTAVLALMTALGPLATDMYLPSLPAIGAEFAATPAEVQATLSIFLLGFAAGQIVYGPFSDKYGRRPLLLAGLALFLVGSLGCALATGIEALYLARFVQAFGASGPIVLARAVVRDLYEGPRAARELSRMGTIMGLVPAAAPVVGGLLHRMFGWQASFYACALAGVLGTTVVARLLPETVSSPNPARISLLRIVASFAALTRHRGFLAYLALMSLTYGGLFAWISGSSFVLQGIYGVSEVAFGLYFAIGVLGYISGTVLAQRLVPRLGMERTIGVGTVMLAAGGVLMLLLVIVHGTQPLEIVAPMALYLCGVGLVMPQSMAGALMPFPDRAGTASSFAGFVQMLTGAAIGALLAQALGESPLPLPVAVTITGIASLLIFRYSRNVRAAGAAPRDKA
jgi:DHA1 family bicyclomycin/chloramphenicol resistance-like MFS transporter